MSKSTEEKLAEDKKFVSVWMEANKLGYTQSWIAEQLGVSRQHVSAKATYMKVMGVELPMYARGRPGSGDTVVERKDSMRFRVEVLNELIKEMEK